jgi:hypothetical protein
MFMKTLKDYIKLLEDSEPSPGLRAVGVTEPKVPVDAVADAQASSGVDTGPKKRTPVDISIMYTNNSDDIPTIQVSVYANPETTFDTDTSAKNNHILRQALTAGGIPMPDDGTGTANTSDIQVIVSNGNIQASAWGQPAERLLEILRKAGLADENGNAIMPQEEQEPESEEEITEEATDEAVERVVKLSRELRKR